MLRPCAVNKSSFSIERAISGFARNNVIQQCITISHFAALVFTTTLNLCPWPFDKLFVLKVLENSKCTSQYSSFP